MDLSDSIGLALFTILFTFLSNTLFKFLQNKFDFMTDVKKFKRDYYFKQLDELYMELYSIIAQSEFLRKFHDLDVANSFKEIPFIEIQKSMKKVTKNLITGEETNNKVEPVEDAITMFNKIGLVETILKKKQFASQDLLKLAVAYRYCHEYYQDTTIDKDRLEKFQTTELDLIYKIVTTVIQECNANLKLCKMDYNKLELDQGKMDNEIFNISKTNN